MQEGCWSCVRGKFHAKWSHDGIHDTDSAYMNGTAYICDKGVHPAWHRCEEYINRVEAAKRNIKERMKAVLSI